MGPSQERAVLENSKISDYLNFYVKMAESPCYAILLKGEWGSGKTWFISKFRKDHPEQKFLYASLYGITSLSDIDDQFFQQLHPLLASKGFSLGAQLCKGLLRGALKVELTENAEADLTVPEGVSLKSFLKKTEDRILIFDDLERCKIAEDVLGYINHFVEHGGSKVIILAHEEKIDALEKFRQRNEKLIGRKFTINAEIEGAYDAFVDLVKEPLTKGLLTENKSLVLGVYERSKHRNLRTLKFSITEFERFISQIPNQAKSNAAFMADCMNCFFSLCIELRAGVIVPETIKSLSSAYRQHVVQKNVKDRGKKVEVVDDPLAAMYERHFGSNLQPLSPNEESLYFFFEYGFIPTAVIKDAISSSGFFPKDQPAWVKLWRVYDLEDDEFDRLYTDVLSDFTKFKFVNEGEFRHVVGILLSLSEKGLVAAPLGKVRSLVQAVTTHMIKNQLIEQVENRSREFLGFGNAYRGLQFHSFEDNTFKKISERLRKYQEDKAADSLKIAIDSFPELMKTDPLQFYSLLTPTVSSDQKYCERPVLKALPVETFVNTLIEMSPSGRLHIAETIKARYQHLNVFPNLAEELQWLERVQRTISRRVKKLKQPTKHTLEVIGKDYVAVAIDGVRRSKKAK